MVKNEALTSLLTYNAEAAFSALLAPKVNVA